jgi:hypothetical protein
MNVTTTNPKELAQAEPTSINTQYSRPQPQRQWWEDFRKGISLRRNSNVSPVQQQCWSDFKHDIYLHTIANTKLDPYGFESAGPSREPTPKIGDVTSWEDFKHNVSLKAADRLEKNPYGFTSEPPSRKQTPALPLHSSGQVSQSRG